MSNNPIPTNAPKANGLANGTPGESGDPIERRFAANRDAIFDAVGPEQVKRLLVSLWERGMEGHIAAARLCLQYAVGRPPREPETVEADPRKEETSPVAGTGKLRFEVFAQALAEATPAEVEEFCRMLQQYVGSEPPFAPLSNGADRPAVCPAA